MKKVKIFLRNETVADGQCDGGSFTYEGNFERIGDADYLKYSELTDGARINTVIKAKGNTVFISRTGGVGSVLQIELGKTHKTEYKTAYGTFSLSVLGERVENELSDKGRLLTEYSLLNEAGLIGRNSIEILIKEV